jgi:hypothetical protein
MKGERTPTAPKESGYARRNPTKVTWKATPKWYVVLAGRQVGIYRDWNRAKGYVDGYSNAFYRGFKNFGEAKAFYREGRGETNSGCEYDSPSESSASEIESPVLVDPQAADRKKAAKRKKVSIADSTSDGEFSGREQPAPHERGGHEAPSSAHNNKRGSFTTGNLLTDVVSSAHAGADKSTETNEVHGINMANEAAAYRLLAPPGGGTEVERSLVNAAIDVSSLPGKGINDYNTAETALQEISTTLSESLRGEEFQVRGRITEDHRWKNATKDHLRSIKSAEDLRESQELLYDIEGEAVANMENGWRAVLYEHMGWDDDTVNLWLRVGVLPNLIRNSLLHYKALLTEVDYMCGGMHMSKQAEIFLNFHAKKLALIRTHRACTRLQLVWMTYTYLRDARSGKFSSQSLQAKQTDALREELDSLRNDQGQRNNRNNRGNPGGDDYQGGNHYQGGNRGGGNGGGQGGNRQGNQEDGGNHQPQGGRVALLCSGCKSKKIHPEVGRRGCPFNAFSDVLARKMAKTAEELMVAGKTKTQAINEAIQKHQHEG